MKTLSYVALCAVFVAPLTGLGQTYTDETAWLSAANCPNFTTEDFDSFPVNNPGSSFITASSPFAVAFGEITTPIIDNDGEDILILRNDLVTNAFDSQALVMISAVVTYDLIPTVRSDAFGLTYLGDLEVQLFDGSTLVHQENLSATVPSFFGFADAATQVDRVVLNLTGSSAAVSVVKFGDGCVMNTSPTANAGPDQSIRSGDTVFLDGTGSFDDNTGQAQLLYSWNIESKPATSTATLTGPNTATPSLFIDVAGTYVVGLVVTDEEGLASAPAYVEVSSNNLAPTSVATADSLLAVVGDTIQFDGAGSTDPEQDPLDYEWSITSAPAGSTAALSGTNSVTTSLTVDVEGVYSVRLVVSDFIGPGGAAEIEITVSSVAEFAEILILEASEGVADLDANQVTTRGNKRALIRHLARAIRDLQRGEINRAITKLEQARRRTDGCALRGSPDGNGPGRDWITDCPAQLEIYGLITSAIDALSD